jgi:hypothetical protein
MNVHKIEKTKPVQRSFSSLGEGSPFLRNPPAGGLFLKTGNPEKAVSFESGFLFNFPQDELVILVEAEVSYSVICELNLEKKEETTGN